MSTAPLYFIPAILPLILASLYEADPSLWLSRGKFKIQMLPTFMCLGGRKIS